MASSGKRGGQRTKGNVKPSSSAKAAEVLSSFGVGVSANVGFLGFGAGSTDEDFVEDLDADFRVVFRKLFKKEPTTRIKASRELIELIEKSEENVVYVAFQCWPRVFSKVSLDVDFKVREESHNVLNAFFKKLGRRIGSQVKGVLPFWLLGENDSYPLAAAAAKSAFQSAFPGPKRTQALNFCKESVLNECADILYGERSYKADLIPVDEENSSEMRIARLCSCSLQTSMVLLSELGDDDCSSLANLLKERFLDQSKFWSFAKHKISTVKCSWINFVVCVVQRFPDLAKNYAERISPAVVNNLERQSADVCRAAFDAVLLCLEKFPQEFWKNVNFQKAFFPKVVSILRKGGDSMAAYVCPALLPIVDKLKTAELTDLDVYFLKIMSNFEQGVRVCNDIKVDAVERVAFVRSFFDCAKFILLSLASNAAASKQVLNENCFNVTEICLKSDVLSAHKEISSMLADFLAFVFALPQKRLDFDEELSKRFVAGISNICSSSITENIHVASISSFLCFGVARIGCRQFVATICDAALNSYDGKMSNCCFDVIGHVLSKIEDEAFFLLFRLEAEEESVKSPTEKLVERLTKAVFVVDKKSMVNFAECLSISSCLFSTWRFMKPTYREEMIIDLLSLLKSTNMIFAILAQIVEVLNDVSIETLRSTVVRDAFLRCFAEMSQQIVDDGVSTFDWQVFVKFLRTKRNEEIVLTSLVEAVLIELLTLIESKSTESLILHRCVDLVAQITIVLFSGSSVVTTSPSAQKLILSLFDIYAAEDVPNSLRKTLATTLDVAAEPNVVATGGILTENSLMTKVARRLINRMMSQNLDDASVQRCSEVAVEVLCKFNASLSSESERTNVFNESTLNFFHEFFPTKNQWISWIDDISGHNSTWKINAQFAKELPFYEIAAESFDFKSSASETQQLIRLCSYSLRLLRLSFSKFDMSSVEEPFPLLSIFSDCMCATIALVVYLTNIFEYSVVVGVEYFDSFAFPSMKVVLDEFATLENQVNTHSTSIARCAVEKDNLGGLWQLVSTLCARDFETVKFAEETVAVEDEFDDFQRYMDTNEKSRLNILANVLCGFVKAGISVEEKISFLKRFVENQDSFNEVLLFNSDISTKSEEEIRFNVALVRLLDSVVDSLPDLPGDQLDFVLCSLLAWIQSCSETKISSSACCSFALVVCQLFNKIATSIKSMEAFSTIADDWNEFFLNGCEAVLVPYFLQLRGDDNCCALKAYVIRELATALDFVGEGKLLTYSVPLLLSPDLDALKYPSNLQSILLNFCPLLIDENNRHAQIGAYNILKKVVCKMYEFEVPQIEEKNKKGEEAATRSIPSYFLSALNTSFQNLHETFSDNAEDDDLSTIHQDHRLNARFLGYLLTWKLLLKFMSSLKTRERPVYSSFLQNSGLLGDLLTVVFFVVADFDGLSMVKKSKDGSRSIKQMLAFLSNGEEDFVKVDRNEFFTSEPQLNANGFDSQEIVRLACNVYFEALCTFPAAVRQWYNNCKKTDKASVEGFTSKYVSPILCAMELQIISKSSKQFDRMTLSARTAAKEIAAIYKFEDLNMELVVAVPPTYPLTQVVVSAGERVGVSADRWRKWMLNLNLYLSQQNGSILDGLLLWKSSIDKHLDGVEDCTICLMTMHGSNYSLPTSTCRQCKKKFHGNCLLKWFDTSNSTKCPMCRNEF